MNKKKLNFFDSYFNSAWIPFAVFCCVVFLSSVVSPISRLTMVSIWMVFLEIVTFLGMFAAAIVNFVKKRWKKGIVNLGLAFLPIIIAGLLFMRTMAGLWDGFLGPSEDGFADNLSIPSDIEIAEPRSGNEIASGKADDAFQKNLLAALTVAGNNDPSVTADVSSLTQLNHNAPDMLKRYLATSPAWRLFTERGNLFATRRMMVGSRWRDSLHGYYPRFDLDQGSDKGIPDFQGRFSIGFSGKPWWAGSSQTTHLREGQTANLILSRENQLQESHCVIDADGLVVEVFEQSPTQERRLTKAALVYFQKELSPLVPQPTWDKIKERLPPQSIKNGEPSIQLWSIVQPGIYDSELWVNPGEPGMVYLKAFEVTKNYPLSVESLKESSNEWIGWSDNPVELFFSNTDFMIYEGDWGKPYAARFEVWFVPDSGAPERKLMEKIFKIDGWQR